MRREICLALTLGAVALSGCSDKKSGSRSAASASSPATVGTSSTTTPPPTTAPGPSRFLYSANYGDASITQLSLDAATGAPTVVGTVALGDVPLRLVVDPTHRFLYAIERSEVTPLAIGPAGDLTPIGAGPVVVAGDYPMGACATPDGALLLVGYYGGGPGGSVRSFAIGAAGALTPVGHVALGATANPVDVLVDAASRFAYVVDEIGQTITVLSIVPGAGALVPVGAPVPCADARALALDATGAFLIVMTSASPGSIQSYAVAANGAITPRSAPLGLGPHSPMALTRGPDGRLYVVTANSSLIVATLDAQGTLTESSVTSIPAFGFPSALALDASGRSVYTANFAGDDLSVLTVGATGAISAGQNVAVAPRTAGNTTQPSFLVTVR